MSKFHSVPVSDSALRGRMTVPLIISVLAAGLGSSFIFGYNIGVINSAGATIQRWIAESNDYYPANYSTMTNLTDSEFMDKLSRSHKDKMVTIWSCVVSIFPAGAIVGGLLTGLVADKFGRKGGMLLNNIFTFAGGLIMFLSKTTGHYGVLILGRLIIGVNCGLNSGLAPMYLTEISPVNYRGLLGSVSQLSVTISILLSNLLGFDSLLGNSGAWPYLLGFTIIPSIYQLVTLPCCPESPKYLLITKGRDDEARNALVKLRQTNDVDAEMVSMQNEADILKAAPKASLVQIFRHPVTRRAMTIAIMLMISQQLSGINAVMFYSARIFTQDAGLSEDTAIIATIGVSLVNVLMTVVSTVIVDKAGRRTLHLTGLGGMFISTALLVICLDLSGKQHQWAAYASIFFVITFVISFASGPGSIPWFYVSECFEQGARGRANSVAVGINWLFTFLVGLLFPHAQRALEQFSCLIFTAFLGVFFLLTWKFVPETKGKSIEQVTAELRRAVSKNN